MLNLEKLKEVVLEAADNTVKYQKTKFRTNLSDLEEKSSHSDLVSEVDKHSQEIVVDYILNNSHRFGFKPEDIGFVGEEDDLHDVDKDLIFIIDPLDGTINFVTGFEMFGPIISVVYKGETILGVFDNTMFDRVYWAVKGQGAFCLNKQNNSERKLVVKPKPTQKIVLTASHKRIFEMNKTTMTSILSARFGINSSAQQFAYLAEGVFDVEISSSPRLWDVAGMFLLIREAGGQVYWLDSEGVADIDLMDRSKTYEIMAGHPDNVKIVRDLLNEPN